jgi:hypothetical protein
MDSGADTTPPDQETAEIRCAECGNRLVEGQDRQETDDAVFCRPCFERLTHELGQAIAAQGENINYPMALVGGLAGAAAGALIWWGFTVVTNIAFGLVAVVIGFAVGKGVTMLAGGKRHLNLQIISVVISIAGFAYASYLVNRTFLIRAFAEQAQEIALPLLPNPELFYDVLSAGFGLMDLVFLAIAVYQAWKIPAPFALATQS